MKDGEVLKVDAFLNHQMDVGLINELGREFHRRFADAGVTKILTIEASGIGIACITAQYFGVPVVFAKKTQSRNIDGEVLTTQVTSFTHQRNYDVIVSKRFLDPSDRVLLIDDFLANRALRSRARASASKRASTSAVRPCAARASGSSPSRPSPPWTQTASSLPPTIRNRLRKRRLRASFLCASAGFMEISRPQGLIIPVFADIICK